MRISLKNFFRKLLTGGALAAATLGGASASQGAIGITDGSFETPSVGGYYGSYGGTSIGGVKWTPHNMYPGGYTNGNLNIFSSNPVTGVPAGDQQTGDQYMAATHLGAFGPNFSNFSGSVGSAPTGLYIDQVVGRVTGADTARTFTLSADLIRALGPFWGMGPASYKDASITIGFIDGATGKILAQNSINYDNDYTDTTTAFKSTVTLNWNAAGMAKGTLIKAFIGFTLDNTTVAGVDGDTASVDNVVLTPSIPYPTVPTLTWRGSGSPSTQWSLAPSVKNWTNGTTSVAYVDDSPVVFDDTATGSTTVDVSVDDVIPGSVTFNNSTKDYLLQGSRAVLGMDLTKSGSGKLTITNNNDFQGSITVSGGVLQVGNGGTTGALGPAAIVNNASLVFKRSNTVTLGNDISGSGSLTQDGTGKLQLTNHYSYTGGTIVNSGILELAPSYDNGSGTIRGTLTINSGATVRQTNSNTLGWWGSSHVDTLNIIGGTLDNNNLSQHFWNCAVNMTGGSILIGPGNVQVGGGSNTVFTVNSSSSTATISGNGYLNLRENLPSNTLVCNVADGTQPIDFSITNVQGNGRTISKTGDGTMEMTGALNNSGLNVAVSGGTLILNKASVPGTVCAIGSSHAEGLTINPGATVKLAGTGGDQIYTETGVNIDGTLDFNGRNEGFWSVTGGWGTVTNSAAATTSVMTLGETSDTISPAPVFYGSIQNGAGSMALVKTGANTLTLYSANNYTGGTTVNGGTLVLAEANTALGPIQVSGGATLQADWNVKSIMGSIIPATSSVTLANGNLSLQGNGATHNQTINGLTLASFSANTVSAVEDSGSGNLTVNLGAITRNSFSTLNLTLPAFGSVLTTTGAANQVIRDATTGAAYATVNGTDWAAKNGTNSAIVAYSAYVNNTWAAGNNTTVTANNTQTNAATSTLRFGDSTGYVVTLSGTNSIANGILVSAYSGSGTITGGSLRGVAGGELIIHQFNESSDFTISSTIVNPSTGSTLLFKTGLGTLALSPTSENTYSGGTVVGMGKVTLNTADLKNAGAGTLQINAGGTVNAMADNTFGLATSGSLTPVWVNGGTLALSANNDLNLVTLTGGLIGEGNTTLGTGMNMQTVVATAPLIKSLASGTTSQILAKITMNSDLTIDCEKGTAAADLELPRIDLITGAYSIHKTGLGTLKIGSGWLFNLGKDAQAIAGWTGDTVVDQGKLVINSGNWTGDANATGRSLIISANGEAETVAPHSWGNSAIGGGIVINGGTLTITSEFYNPPITMTGGLIRGTAELRSGYTVTTKSAASSAVISANVASAWGAGTIFAVEDGAAPVDLLVSGSIRGGKVTKSGAGLLALSAANTYADLTTVSEGTLELVTGGSLAAGNNVTTGTGAMFKIEDGTHLLGTISGTGTTDLVSGSLTATSITQDILSNNGAVFITASAGTINTVSGSGILTVQAGALNATSIVQDTLIIGNTGAAAVPEPGTLALLVLAGLGAAVAYLRRK